MVICFAGGHVLLAAAGATGVCLNLVQNAITSQEAPLAESHSLRMSRHVVFWQAPAEEEGETLRGVCKRRTSFRTSYTAGALERGAREILREEQESKAPAVSG